MQRWKICPLYSYPQFNVIPAHHTSHYHQPLPRPSQGPPPILHSFSYLHSSTSLSCTQITQNPTRDHMTITRSQQQSLHTWSTHWCTASALRGRVQWANWGEHDVIVGVIWWYWAWYSRCLAGSETSIYIYIYRKTDIMHDTSENWVKEKAQSTLDQRPLTLIRWILHLEEVNTEKTFYNQKEDLYLQSQEGGEWEG